jgi:hypothetical protein
MGYTSDGTANAEVHWGDVAALDSATNSQLLVAYWVKLTSNPGADTGVAFSKSDFSTNGFWQAYVTALDSLAQTNFDTPTVGATIVSAPVAGQGWIHIGFWHDIGTPTWRTYVNGVGTDQDTGSGIGAPLGNSTANLRALCGTAAVILAECALWAKPSGLTVTVANAIMAKLANAAGAERVATAVTDSPVTFYAPLATHVNEVVLSITGTNTNLIDAGDHPWTLFTYTLTATAAAVGFTARDSTLTWSGTSGAITETWPIDHDWPAATIDGDQPWTLVTNGGAGFRVVSGAAGAYADGVTTATNIARCETALATADHEASVALGPMPDSNGTIILDLGVAVRFAAAAETFYYGIWDGQLGRCTIGKSVAGTLTGLASVATTCVANDVLRLRVTGTAPVTLTLFKNGAAIGSVDDTTGNPLTGGVRAGIYLRLSRFAAGFNGVHTWSAADVVAGGGATYTLTATRLAVGITGFAATLTWSGGSPPAQSATVWYGPDLSSPDLLAANHFLHPEDWPTARALVNVFKTYGVENTAPGPFTKDSMLTNWNAAGAWGLLQGWGMKIAVEAAVVANWGTPAFILSSIMAIIDGMYAAGGWVDYITLQEPFYTGQVLTPPFTPSEIAGYTKTFVDTVHASYPSIQIGDIEPWDNNASGKGTDNAGLQAWVGTLAAAGVTLPFFHLDIWFPGYSGTEWGSLVTFLKTNNIPCGITLFGLSSADDDATYIAEVEADIDKVVASGIQYDHYIFQSWCTRNSTGVFDVPADLPETTANRFTKVIIDGCATLNLGVPAYQPRVQALGRGAWRGTWRGTYAGSR